MTVPKNIPTSWVIPVLLAGMYLGRYELRMARAEDRLDENKRQRENIVSELKSLNIAVAGIQAMLGSQLPILRQDTEVTKKEIVKGN